MFSSSLSLRDLGLPLLSWTQYCCSQPTVWCLAVCPADLVVLLTSFALRTLWETVSQALSQSKQHPLLFIHQTSSVFMASSQVVWFNLIKSMLSIPSHLLFFISWVLFSGGFDLQPSQGLRMISLYLPGFSFLLFLEVDVMIIFLQKS